MAASLLRICVLALLAAASPAHAQPSSSRATEACIAYVPEAASRSGLSADLLIRVMRAESGGNARIVSVKGAMGCMQIMPATWAYLTARYTLGADPFDPRRNMIGGAMYLAELMTRYRMAGAIAAYNAGPGRYERYAAGRATLPAETIAYASRIGTGVTSVGADPTLPRWQEAGLFLPNVVKPTSASGPVSVGRAVDRRAADPLFPLAKFADTSNEPPAAR